MVWWIISCRILRLVLQYLRMNLLSQECESLSELLSLFLHSLYSLHDAVVFLWPHTAVLLISTVWRDTFLRWLHLHLLLPLTCRWLERIHLIIRDSYLKYFRQFFFIKVITTGFTIWLHLLFHELRISLWFCNFIRFAVFLNWLLGFNNSVVDFIFWEELLPVCAFFTFFNSALVDRIFISLFFIFIFQRRSRIMMVWVFLHDIQAGLEMTVFTLFQSIECCDTLLERLLSKRLLAGQSQSHCIRWVWVDICFFFFFALFWCWCLKAALLTNDGGNVALTPTSSALVGILGRRVWPSVMQLLYLQDIILLSLLPGCLTSDLVQLLLPQPPSSGFELLLKLLFKWDVISDRLDEA